MLDTLNGQLYLHLLTGDEVRVSIFRCLRLQFQGIKAGVWLSSGFIISHVLVYYWIDLHSKTSSRLPFDERS
jgi:hypothetical protein